MLILLVSKKNVGISRMSKKRNVMLTLSVQRGNVLKVKPVGICLEKLKSYRNHYLVLFLVFFQTNNTPFTHILIRKYGIGRKCPLMKMKDKTDTTEYIVQIETELSKLRRREHFC
jgi:hypothetical protein